MYSKKGLGKGENPTTQDAKKKSTETKQKREGTWEAKPKPINYPILLVESNNDKPPPSRISGPRVQRLEEYIFQPKPLRRLLKFFPLKYTKVI